MPSHPPGCGFCAGSTGRGDLSEAHTRYGGYADQSRAKGADHDGAPQVSTAIRRLTGLFGNGTRDTRRLVANSVTGHALNGAN
jgi:hypothetical protein